MKDRPHNSKATKGNITHKALELLARKKLATQRNEPTFTEGEIGQTWDTEQFSPEVAIKEAWRLYAVIREPHWDWTGKDLLDCTKWMHVALNYNSGMFSPLKRTVIQPEQYFDFVLEDERFRYKYKNPFGGEPIEGLLGIKGTVDLVVGVDNSEGVIEYLDWKTGQRKDWNTGHPKDFKSLRKDPQLRLYHYALSKLYPDARSIIISIFFLRDGGPFSLPFSREDIAETEDMLHKRFREMADCEQPKRIKPSFKCSWCSYNKDEAVDHEGKKTGMNICDFMHKEIQTIGMDRVTARYGDQKAMTSYGEGGGRAAK